MVHFLLLWQCVSCGFFFLIFFFFFWQSSKVAWKLTHSSGLEPTGIFLPSHLHNGYRDCLYFFLLLKESWAEAQKEKWKLWDKCVLELFICWWIRSSSQSQARRRLWLWSRYYGPQETEPWELAIQGWVGLHSETLFPKKTKGSQVWGVSTRW